MGECKRRLVLAALLLGNGPAGTTICLARGFSTVLPLHVEMPSTATATPATRRTTVGKIVDFAKQFLPLGESRPGHDSVTGASIGQFGPAYQNASLVGHGLAPPGETVGR